MNGAQIEVNSNDDQWSESFNYHLRSYSSQLVIHRNWKSHRWVHQDELYDAIVYWMQLHDYVTLDELYSIPQRHSEAEWFVSVWSERQKTWTLHSFQLFFAIQLLFRINILWSASQNFREKLNKHLLQTARKLATKIVVEQKELYCKFSIASELSRALIS